MFMVSMFAFLRMSLAVRSQEVAFVGKCSLCLLGRGGERGRSWCRWPERRGQGTGGQRDAGCSMESWEGLASGGKRPGRPPRGESRAEHQAAQSHLETLLPGLWVLWGSPALGPPEEGRCGHTAWSMTHGKESSAVCFPS